MRLNVTPEEFADVVLSFLLDGMTSKSEEDNVALRNEFFAEFINKMSSKGFRQLLLRRVITLPAKNKVKYKYFRRVLEEGYTDVETVRVQQEKAPKKKEKTDKRDKSVAKSAVKKAVQILTQSADPNPKKLDALTERVIDEMIMSGEL